MGVLVQGNDGLTKTGFRCSFEKHRGGGSLRRVASIDTGGETLCYEDIIVENVRCVPCFRKQGWRSCEAFMMLTMIVATNQARIPLHE